MLGFGLPLDEKMKNKLRGERSVPDGLAESGVGGNLNKFSADENNLTWGRNPGFVAGVLLLLRSAPQPHDVANHTCLQYVSG